jgi:GNAT superfamily N-acetyltransferase
MTGQVQLADGAVVMVRELESDDAPRLQRLHERLSPKTVYQRFMTPTPRLSKRTLEQLANVDHVDREALVATTGNEIVAVARYVRRPGGTEAEVAIVVEDTWQRRGVGRILIERLVAGARRRGIRAFSGTMLSENRAAQAMLRAFFPNASVEVNGPELRFRAQVRPVPLGGSRVAAA